MQSIPDVVKCEKLWNDEFHSFSKHNDFRGIIMSKYIVTHGIRIAKDFIPETFGRLTTIGPKFRMTIGSKGRSATYQVYICSCENITVCAIANVKAGRTQSCGCFNDENRVVSNTKHGHTSGGNKRSLTYRSYVSMKHRCYYKANNRYYIYGGRGITVCDRWLCPVNGFLNFLADMGPRPSRRHSIERKDVNGNYCQENCCWATVEEQAHNRSNNHNLTFNGKTQCLSEWSRELGIRAYTISSRIKKGWSVEEALTTPVGKARKSARSKKDVARDTKNNHNLTHSGKTQCVAAWEEETGICGSTIIYRVKHGWSVEKALTTPTKQ